MKKGTLGYLISPMDYTIQRVKLDEWQDIYRWIEADTFEPLRFNADGDMVYVDENATLRKQPNNNFFIMNPFPDPLIGKGLILGTDIEGESIDPSVSWEKFKSLNIARPVLMVAPDKGVMSDFMYVDDIEELKTS